MKVQLQGQSLRLRIDEEELARLLAGKELVNETQAAPGAIACQRLRLLVGGAARFDADGGAWTFSLPDAEVRGYVARLPCRDALEFELPGGGAALKLAFEVDVRDSVRRRGPPQRRRTPRPE
ncbi:MULTISPECIES: hypothetical protein [unclassified Luteimonas]